MPHINLGNDAPGIVSLFAYRPEAAKSMIELVDLMLCGPNTLTRGERELIGAYVSSLNDCEFCAGAHGAFAAAQLPEGMALIDQVRADLDTAEVPAKMRALLRIAGAVQRGGKHVREQDVAAARDAGATDLEIHDTVLIAAMFCLANRYVDGLATTLPDDPATYPQMAELIVSVGYSAVSGKPLGAAGLLPERFSGRRPQPGYRSGDDQDVARGDPRPAPLRRPGHPGDLDHGVQGD